jgi:N-acetylneuraminate synthase
MNNRVYVIAEAGVNHDGSVDDALRLVDAAADAGADCVKFQTFNAEALASAHADKAGYQRRTTDVAESQQAMLKRLELPNDAYRRLMQRAAEHDIDFLSTPFDPISLNFLIRDLQLPRIKVGSGDMTNAPMLLAIAEVGREIILSTGMATLAEVDDALSVLAFGYAHRTERPSRQSFAAAWSDPAHRKILQDKVVLLHCTTEYPAEIDAVNLKAIDTLAATFGLPVGYSDHTLGIEIATAAVARGAVMLEKHLTLDRARSGPDHAASIEPAEFTQMVDSIRRVEIALGDGRKTPQPAELPNIPIARKAVVAARPIEAGETFTAENLTLKRPGVGLPPIMLWETIGQAARRAYRVDEAIDP